jgi:molybdate transport system substrate-binding protein
MKVALVIVSALLLGACGSISPSASSTSLTSDSLSGTIKVFAAASLTAVFMEEGRAFRALHPKADLQFNFAGSAALATQINQGAPADVFASADLPNMNKVVAAGNTSGKPQNFATNRLQVVVAAGNPKRINGLGDLARPGTVVVLCAPAVPCGNYANQVLAKASVKLTPRSLEQDVNAVLSKVSLGEADAGIVYVTDVRAAGSRVQGVSIPAGQNVVASYPVAPVKNGSNSAGGKAFIDFLLGPSGQGILTSYAFVKP